VWCVCACLGVYTRCELLTFAHTQIGLAARALELPPSECALKQIDPMVCAV
jgi:hypothetical protein